MRDKLIEEEYLRERYNKDDARYTKYMATYQIKLSNPEQYDIKSCKYHAFIFAFNKFYCGYSLGLDLKEFLPEIKLILQNLIETRKERDSNYEDMEFIVHFILLFNQTEFLDEYKKLLEKSEHRDFYLDSVMQCLDSSWQISTEKILWPKEIKPLCEVIQLSKTDQNAAVQRLKKYLDKEWFKTLTEGLITNRQLEKGMWYRGYWCIEAAKEAFSVIKEQMIRTDSMGESKGTVILATVKGDIHDIGKNIVKVLMENYSFTVIDLGRDVPPEKVLETVREGNIRLVGLSALMTTTVPSMEATIKLLRKEAPWCTVCVGGAVMTREYADMIGADFYGRDALETVRFAQEFFGG